MKNRHPLISRRLSRQTPRLSLSPFDYQCLEPRNLLASLLNSSVAQPLAGPQSLVYDVNELTPVEARMDLLRAHLDLDANESLQLIRLERDQYGFAQFKYQQLYDGIPVQNGQYTVHVKDRQIVSLSGDFKNVGPISTTPVLTEATAFNRAIENVNADTYLIEQADSAETIRVSRDELVIGTTNLERSPGEPVIVKNTAGDYVLAFKFDVYSLEPEVSRAYVYVDARSGDVVASHDRLRHADVPATGIGIYDGAVEFTADQTATEFRLRQQANHIQTFDLNGSVNPGDGVDITSVSNTFTDPSMHVGVQAHYSLEQTLEYYASQFNRFGYDNQGGTMRAYTEYASNLANAFWDGTRLLLGNGDGIEITPLVAVDVVAHEASHGVSEAAVDLIYERESGALNESLSDMFGEAVEHYTYGTADWIAGAAITVDGQGFRSLSNPKLFQMPDTYFGEYWWTYPQDNYGVHTNSSVTNKWFYLLSEGGFGTNDHGFEYDVEGIGITDAASIAYRMMTVYLTPESGFVDARVAAIKSAIDLFGHGSFQYQSTLQAWDAVGVYDPFVDLVEATQNRDPSGSMVFSQAYNNAFERGFTYTYVFDLDAGQSLSVAVDGEGTLIPTISVYDSQTNQIASVSGETSNSVIVQSIPIDNPGRHFVVVGGDNDTFGEFNIELWLNANIELESHHGPANATFLTAQNIDSSVLSFTNPTGNTTIERLSVSGKLDELETTSTVIDHESFESGFGAGWTTQSTGSGRIEISDTYGAADGNFSLLMDSSSGYALNEAIWTVDLSNYSLPALRFSHTEWGDEDHVLPGSFSGSYHGDGVAVSDDGVTWHTVMTNGSTNDGEWHVVDIDLAAISNQTGITLGPNFRIKFQQYDNFALPNDGRGYDLIEIIDNTPAADWYSFQIADGQRATIAASAYDSGAIGMALYDDTGTLVQSSSNGTNIDRYIQQFVGDGSTYYVQVTGNSEYNLVVTRGADFDVEPNGSSVPQDITNVGGVFGHVAGVGLVGADPDDAPVNSVVDYFFPTVVLSNNITGGSVYALDGTEYGAPTGNHVFARAPERGWYWRTGADEFRADFEFLQRRVSIDVGSDVSGGDRAYLRAFDRNGFLLQEVVSGVLPQGGSETLTIDTVIGRIAYITAAGLPGLVVPLDNLVFDVNITDNDYYTVDVQAGEMIRYDVIIPGAGDYFFNNRLTQNSPSSLVVELYDPNGQLVAADPWSINEVATTTGTYELLVYTTEFLGEYILLRDIVPGIDEPPGIDFGPIGSNVYQNYAAVSDDAYSAAIGYGWLNVTGFNAISENRGNDLVRDKVILRNGTFAIDVDNGIYDVDVVLGVVKKTDAIQISVEGQADTFTPQPGPYVVKSYLATVTDGQLTIGLDGLAGLDNQIKVAGITLTEVQGRPVAGGDDSGGKPSDIVQNLLVALTRVTQTPSGESQMPRLKSIGIETINAPQWSLLGGSLVLDERQVVYLPERELNVVDSKLEPMVTIESLLELGEEFLEPV